LDLEEINKIEKLLARLAGGGGGGGEDANYKNKK
jgi:hypothetical protein